MGHYSNNRDHSTTFPYDEWETDREDTRESRNFTKLGTPPLILPLSIFVNGLLEILQVLLTRFPMENHFFDVVLPFGLFYIGRSLTLALGFMLIYLAFRLYQRRRMAWWLALAATMVAIVVHLLQWRLWYTVFTPILTMTLLLFYHERFTVRAEPRSLKQGFLLMGMSILLAVGYGTLGFYLLDKRDFGREFYLSDALIRTLREFTLMGNSDLQPNTRHARWFIDSLRLMGILAAFWAAYSLFRPVTYRFVTLPHERHSVQEIVVRYGCSSYDFFKLRDDKSYFFSKTKQSFIAYKSLMGVAISLGDPVGPNEEIEDVTKDFLRFCSDNGWIVTFLLPDLIPMYRKLDCTVLKIGEGAIVDLNTLCSITANKKYFRYIRRKLEEMGITYNRYYPPHNQKLIDELKDISDDWLSMPGHREFGFFQGTFSREYMNSTTIDVLRNASGEAIAFVNEVPSYRPGEATVDMMRHRNGMHWGTMDFLFLRLMQQLKADGYTTFYLGMAGIVDNPGQSMMEKAIHQLSSHLNWILRAKGMRQFKDKFRPSWEDRYLVYSGNPFSLAKIAIAMLRII